MEDKIFNKKNILKMVSVVIVVIGVILVGVGGCLLLLGDKENPNQTNDTEKIDENTSMEIKEYSEYQNFYLEKVEVTKSNVNSYEHSYYVWVDLENKLMRVKVSSNLASYDSYFDYNNNIQYFTTDEKNWYKSEISYTFLPNFSVYISDALKDDVKKENNTYTYIDSILISEEEKFDYPIKVTFEESGFLKEIIIDLSDVIENNEQKTTYRFSKINELDKIVIPNNVLNDAVAVDADFGFVI